jgi:Ca2+-binding RTX toxin-like protein
VKISGVKSKDGLSVSGNVITVPNKIIGKNVTVNGNGYKFRFAADNTSITGSGNADKIINSGAKVTIAGGKGNDIISLSSAAKNNVISYSNGDGKDIIYGLTADDTIKIAKGMAATSTSGDDVIFTVGKGKITVKGAKNKTFSYSDAEGNKTYSTVVAPSPDDGGDYKVSNDGKGITLSSSYAEKSFDVSEVRGGNAIVTINASLTNGLDITGNDKANYIIGGKGNDTIDGGNDKENDTLTGGKGADIFFYSNGNGNDVISDYEAKDIIKIAKGSSVSNISSPDGRDVVLKVGKGSITVKNAAKKEIGVTYVEDGIEYGYKGGIKTLNIARKTNETIATLSKSYWEDSFDATKLGNEDVGKSITKIDASAVTRTLKITGNDRANIIVGSSTKSNTITGGGGDDTLQGGSGADVFVYTAGDGNDSIISYQSNDVISIASGTANYTVNANNDIVLTVGTGKIILENAGGRKLNYYDDEHRTTPYSALTSANSRSNVWLDDNYELTPDLSAIVQDKSVDYSFLNTSTKLSKETNLIAYNSKK